MPRPDEKLQLGHKELTKLFRGWGWSVKATTVKSVQWIKNGIVVGMKQVTADHQTWASVIEAARVDGVTPEKWIEGKPKPEVQLQPVVNPIKVIEANKPKVVKEPLSRKPDDFTLTDILKMRSMQKNELNRTSCEIITVLAVTGPITDEDGRATAKLCELLPCTHRAKRPIGQTGISMQLKHWDAAGVITRKINGKRCYSIELAVPVHVTDEERRDYGHMMSESATKAAVARGLPVLDFAPKPQPTHRDIFGPEHMPNIEDCALCRQPTPAPVELHVDTAIEVLEKEATLLRSRLRALEFSIGVLKRSKES